MNNRQRPITGPPRVAATLPMPLPDDSGGEGCSHCSRGRPITRVQSLAGKIDLCIDCTLRWHPGADGARFDRMHRLYRDHLTTALKQGATANAANLVQWLEEHETARIPAEKDSPNRSLVLATF